ncbi:hypothetical protein Hanom_Chr17g01533651 [Helianthus anomalus]
MTNDAFISNAASVVTRVVQVRSYLLLNSLQWCLRLSAEGSGVTVEGSAYLPGEAEGSDLTFYHFFLLICLSYCLMISYAVMHLSLFLVVADEEDDNDNGVDLFGEEKKEEKKAAKDHAATVKASGKNKECELLKV